MTNDTHKTAIQLIKDLKENLYDEHEAAIDSMLPIYEQSPQLFEALHQIIVAYGFNKICDTIVIQQNLHNSILNARKIINDLEGELHA